MKKLLLIFGFILVISCNQSEKKVGANKIENKNDAGDNLEYVSALKKRIINSGDSNAFGELVDYYGRHPSEYYELLPIAIISADKHNNDKARVTIYFQMIMMNSNGNWEDKLFFKLNQVKQDFVVSYLIDGVKKDKNSECKNLLKTVLKGGYKLKRSNKEIENLINEEEHKR